MTGYRRAWARLAAVVGGAALVGTSTMSTTSIAAEAPPVPMPPGTAVEQVSARPVAVTAAGASQTLRVTVPEVMVGTPSRTSGGGIAVPVLIAAGGPGGRVSVDPPSTGCSWRLAPGEVTWVRCAASGRNRERVLVVVLDDGRTLARRL